MHKKIYIHPIRCFILIETILVVFWFIASLLLNSAISFSVLIYHHSNHDIVSAPKSKLLKGMKVKVEFTAKENNLGIVILGFRDFVQKDYSEEDYLNFRIREKGTSEWHYSSDYMSGAFERQLNYPFGFPVIYDSKGKIYEIEVTSLFGNEKNAVELNSAHPNLMSGYKFSKGELIGNKKVLVSFLTEKITTSFTDIDFLLRSTLYIIPCVLSFVWFLLRKGNPKTHSKFLVATILGIGVDVLFVKDVYLGIWIILLIGWIASIYMLRLKSNISFVAASICLFVWIPIVYLDTKNIQAKLNLWVYSFLLIGVIQAIIDEKSSWILFAKNNKKKPAVYNNEDSFNYENAIYLQKLEELKVLYYEKYISYINKLSASSGTSFLDVGCGNGTVLSTLKKQGLEKGYGVDISGLFIKSARKLGLKNLYKYTGNTLPFKDNYFGVVGSFNVLEHTRNPELFLKEQLRVVKNGGYVIIACPNFLSIVTSSPHPRIRGLVNRVKNLVRICIRSVVKKEKLERMEQITRDVFQYDDDAIVVTNLIDLRRILTKMHCSIVYESGFIQSDTKITHFIDALPILRYMMPSCFIIVRKN